MRDVAVVGVGMTRFGKFPEKSINDLVRESVEEALKDAGLEKQDIEAAYMANAAAGLITGQEMIRGQVALSAMGVEDLPVYNVESACASSSSAFNLAWGTVASGIHECVIVVGSEKLYHQDKSRSFKALGTGVDIENFLTYFKEAEKVAATGDKIVREGGGKTRSIFMDMYAFTAKGYMRKYGLKQEHFAQLAVKSHHNGSLNPHAQYQQPVTLEEVLGSGDVAYPLTRQMCAPIGDGAAAVVLCNEKKASRIKRLPIWVKGSVVGSGKIAFDLEESLTKRLSPKVFEMADCKPEDIDIIEVHDATSPSEIIALIDLCLCPGSEAVEWIENGALELSGRLPCNTSGGLTTKGHPVGATGCSQIYEIVQQLRHEAGPRQAANTPKIGMTQNGGGIIGIDAAAMTLHIFSR
jgi:acetyl-CoA acetyltransferase